MAILCWCIFYCSQLLYSSCLHSWWPSGRWQFFSNRHFFHIMRMCIWRQTDELMACNEYSWTQHLHLLVRHQSRRLLRPLGRWPLRIRFENFVEVPLIMVILTGLGQLQQCVHILDTRSIWQWCWFWGNLVRGALLRLSGSLLLLLKSVLREEGWVLDLWNYKEKEDLETDDLEP